MSKALGVAITLVALLKAMCPAGVGFISLLRVGSEALASVSHGLRHSDEYASADDWRWLLRGPPHAPPVRAPPTAPSLAAAVAGRVPRLLSRDGAAPQWFRDENGAPLSQSALLAALGRLPQPVACQEQAGGRAFMYYDKDSAVNQGLMRDGPLVAAAAGAADRLAGPGSSGLGDGGCVGSVEATLGQWVRRVMAGTGAHAGEGGQDDAVLYCVEELAFDWDAVTPGGGNGVGKESARGASKGEEPSRSTRRRRSLDPPPRDALSVALAPFLPRVWAAAADDDAGNEEEPVVNVWLHGAGAATQLHYDVAHNVLVQVLAARIPCDGGYSLAELGIKRSGAGVCAARFSRI